VMFRSTIRRAAISSRPSFAPVQRNFASAAAVKPKRVTLVEGDGIGPEIMGSVVGIFSAAEAPVEWDTFKNVDSKDIDDLLVTLAKNQVALKGPLFTPVSGNGWTSRNMKIRKALDLYASVVPVKNIAGVETRHKDVDFVVIRENTEGEYTGLEHEISNGVVQSLKITTRPASIRIAEFAFNYAKENNRNKVTAIHKANIQKLTDGEFLSACREVSKRNPDIKYEEMIIDNASMQMVMNPKQFDVVLTPNLYGTILQNIGSGLIGGPGILAGANYGERGHAVFELGARHVGLDISGKNVADPVGGIFAGVMMLRYLNFNEHANNIEKAVLSALNDKVLTRDIGGTATTREFTKAVIDRLG